MVSAIAEKLLSQLKNKKAPEKKKKKKKLIHKVHFLQVPKTKSKLKINTKGINQNIKSLSSEISSPHSKTPKSAFKDGRPSNTLKRKYSKKKQAIKTVIERSNTLRKNIIDKENKEKAKKEAEMLEKQRLKLLEERKSELLKQQRKMEKEKQLMVDLKKYSSYQEFLKGKIFIPVKYIRNTDKHKHFKYIKSMFGKGFTKRQLISKIKDRFKKQIDKYSLSIKDKKAIFGTNSKFPLRSLINDSDDPVVLIFDLKNKTTYTTENMPADASEAKKTNIKYVSKFINEAKMELRHPSMYQILKEEFKTEDKIPDKIKETFKQYITIGKIKDYLHGKTPLSELSQSDRDHAVEYLVSKYGKKIPTKFRKKVDEIENHPNTTLQDESKDRIVENIEKSVDQSDRKETLKLVNKATRKLRKISKSLDKMPDLYDEEAVQKNAQKIVDQKMAVTALPEIAPDPTTIESMGDQLASAPSDFVNWFFPK